MIRFSRTSVLLISMLMMISCNQEMDLALAESEAPIVGIATEVPDFAAMKDSHAKKKAFFDFLRPIIRAENAKVAKIRVRMLDISTLVDNGDEVIAEDQKWLLALAKKYHIAMPDLDDEEAWTLLKRRVDTVPFRLALAQAANESSWGTSRFAIEGRNFFGEWCFTAGCGLVPAQRREGMTHEVAVFRSVNASVASYIYSLNRVDIYTPLRVKRYKLHKNGNRPTAHELAAGLTGYSERGEDYVDSIRKMIRLNFDLMAETVKDEPKAG